MADATPLPYRLTVRPAQGEPGRFEYVVSLPYAEAVRSDTSFATPEAAKEAGDARGRQMASRAAGTEADD